MNSDTTKLIERLRRESRKGCDPMRTHDCPTCLAKEAADALEAKDTKIAQLKKECDRIEQFARDESARLFDCRQELAAEKERAGKLVEACRNVVHEFFHVDGLYSRRPRIELCLLALKTAFAEYEKAGSHE